MRQLLQEHMGDNRVSAKYRGNSSARSSCRQKRRYASHLQQDRYCYLETTETTGNQNIIELRSNILQLKEQLRVIATLRTKGFINEVKYKEQINDLTAKINKLNKDIRLLSQSDDTILKDTEMLIDYFKKREHIMVEFEPQAFEFLIDKIVVNSNELEFHIIKLVFAEKI